jgi:hypothetical protein
MKIYDCDFNHLSLLKPSPLTKWRYIYEIDFNSFCPSQTMPTERQVRYVYDIDFQLFLPSQIILIDRQSSAFMMKILIAFALTKCSN